MLNVMAVILLIIGILCLFARNAVWRLTVLSNQLTGRASERTQVWDIGTIVVGLIFLALAIIMLFSNI